MLIKCPARLKRGQKTWEQKVATSVGDFVFGAINANGTIKVYVGIEREPNNPSRRFPIAVVAAPAPKEEILGDGGREEAAISVTVYENPKDRTNEQKIEFDSAIL